MKNVFNLKNWFQGNDQFKTGYTVYALKIWAITYIKKSKTTDYYYSFFAP